VRLREGVEKIARVWLDTTAGACIGSKWGGAWPSCRGRRRGREWQGRCSLKRRIRGGMDGRRVRRGSGVRGRVECQVKVVGQVTDGLLIPGDNEPGKGWWYVDRERLRWLKGLSGSWRCSGVRVPCKVEFGPALPNGSKGSVMSAGVKGVIV
jgi:hypothetical protein